MREAVIKHILDRNGVLHEEPVRLFLDDSRDTVQMSTLITIISSGVHRLSEIASRIGKPATHLNRPLQRLIDLGYLKREIPYGTSPLKAKRTLYKVADPFINFYFRYVVPDKTSLELGLAEMIYDKVVVPDFTEYCSGFWEEIPPHLEKELALILHRDSLQYILKYCKISQRVNKLLGSNPKRVIPSPQYIAFKLVASRSRLRSGVEKETEGSARFFLVELGRSGSRSTLGRSSTQKA